MEDRLPDVSVVIPVHDEETAIASLVEEIAQALAGRAFEVIVVDDGSRDGTDQILQTLATQHDWLRPHRHPTPRGQSTAIRSGVRLARAPLIVTLDGDGQNPPDQIPLLLEPLETGGPQLGLIQGQRAGRQDTAAKKLASRFANRLRAALLHDGVRDSGCGLKAFRRDAYLDLPFFDHIHRYMPAMMLREGWQIATIDVTHRGRHGGRSKYSNFKRGLVGIPDLLGAAWLIRRSGRRGLPPTPPPLSLHADTAPKAPQPAPGQTSKETQP